MNQKYYLPDCPLGHKSTLVDSKITLTEGVLRQCSVCGQLLSSCTKHTYDATMQAFDVPDGTSPSGKAIARANKNYHARLKLIQGYLGKSAGNIKLLDLGCSSGDFLEAAKRFGFQVEGLEPASQAALTAQKKGLTVHIGSIEDKNLALGSFDCITLFEVIEHVPDPVSLLKHCQKILKPSGIIMIGTGNTHSWTTKIMKHRWGYFDMTKHGGHISFYNIKSMNILAQTCDFKTLLIKTRALKFFERNETSPLVYKITKVISEIFSLPAKWLNRGHDMLVIFQKQ